MKVKVFNDNADVPLWREKFKGNWVEIPYGKSIEMDLYEATEFKGQYYFATNEKGEALPKGDPRHLKKIRTEQIDWEAVAKEESKTKSSFKCFVCKKPFLSAKEMTIHAVNSHADQMCEDDDAELTMDEPVVQKKKPGPKPKVQAVTAE